MKTEKSISGFLLTNYLNIIPNLFDSLVKILLTRNHSASNCVKSLLIILIILMSPKVTSEYCRGTNLTNDRFDRC